MKGKWITYSAEELAWIEERKDWSRRELHQIFCILFERSDVTVDAIKQLCLRNGWKTGRDGRIKPGNVPANKGKKMPFNANSARTQFKKGKIPANRKFIGHERVSKDGYVEISIAETNPHTGHGRRYVPKHTYLWKKENGPLPDGYCLKCLDGDKTNSDPSNWQAIPRAILPRLNGRWTGINFDEAPPEMKEAIMTAALLQHEARKARNRNG